jgi:hypothetical protein
MSTRRQRGFITEELVADYLRQRGFPHAEPSTRGAAGPDILGVPGVGLEVKAQARGEFQAWLGQARTNLENPEDVCAVVWRRNGDGPTTIQEWPVITDLGTLVWLLREAGYGAGGVHP